MIPQTPVVRRAVTRLDTTRSLGTLEYSLGALILFRELHAARTAALKTLPWAEREEVALLFRRAEEWFRRFFQTRCVRFGPAAAYGGPYVDFAPVLARKAPAARVVEGMFLAVARADQAFARAPIATSFRAWGIRLRLAPMVVSRLRDSYLPIGDGATNSNGKG